PTIRHIPGIIPHWLILIALFHKVLESPSPTPNIKNAFNLSLLVCLAVAVVDDYGPMVGLVVVYLPLGWGNLVIGYIRLNQANIKFVVDAPVLRKAKNNIRVLGRDYYKGP